MTSKLQVTVPKAIAERYRIAPGDEVLWVAAGDAVRLVPARNVPTARSTASRLRLFDKATERQAERDKRASLKPAGERGWKREELYSRGRPR